ncbi:MAG: carboxypeptidase-like regulatory domain-containing protein [Bacteroidales bacterium]|nr:carboxypeptidase-like regulatory domain-containing protein [Bacteroidales bacterium]
MKKAFSILTGLALALVLLTSCEKNPETGSSNGNGISDAGAITGVVKDVETGKAIANGLLWIYPDAATKTDEDGRFLFGHLAPSLCYYFKGIMDIYEDENGYWLYDIVYLSIDGKLRDLSYGDYDDTGYYFSIKAGQVREVEIRVKKEYIEH